MVSATEWSGEQGKKWAETVEAMDRQLAPATGPAVMATRTASAIATKASNGVTPPATELARPRSRAYFPDTSTGDINARLTACATTRAVRPSSGWSDASAAHLRPIEQTTAAAP